MSYGGPPPRKTTYGDQDFVKEDWPSSPTGDIQQAPPSPPSFGQYGGQPQNPSVGTSRYPPTHPTISNLGQPNHTGLQDPMSPVVDITANMTITPEDLMFINSWRRDSFYKRSLPLVLVGCAGLFQYNKMKKLPHSWVRYLGVTVTCFFLGKFAYRNELIRRVQENPSTTPMMQGLRKTLGLPQAIQSDFLTYSGMPPGSGWGRDNDMSGSSTAGYSSLQTNQPWSGSNPYGQLPNETIQPGSFDTPTKGTTYEELRARNRGYVSNK